MGMALDQGGHLSHGSSANFSGKYFHCVTYGVNEQGFIDYDEVERIALECQPKLIVAGASAYCRTIDFKRFREIADKVNAILMVDIAHIAGLVATGLHPSPIPYAHVVKQQPIRHFATKRRHDSLRYRGICKETEFKLFSRVLRAAL